MTICSLVIGPDGHGVVRVATAAAAGRLRRVPAPADVSPALIGDASVVHVHYTDRLFGDRCEESADRFCALVVALGRPVVVTLHDLPMPSQGADLYRRRSAAYGRVVSAAAATIVSSRHEARLLEAATSFVRAHVVPLPIDRLATVRPSHVGDEVGVLGWIYPGKGHADVLAALPRGRSLVALGAVSPGHDELLAELRRDSRFRCTGFLEPGELLRQLLVVGVPVAPGTAISASASIGSWLEAGRRPIVLDGAWVRELDERCPQAVTITESQFLGAAIARAIAAPASTWLGETPVGPTSVEVAQLVRDICLAVAG